MRRGRKPRPDRIIGRYDDAGRANPRGRRVIYVAAGARCSITCESSTEADRWCRRFLADLEAAQELTIGDAIDAYIEHLKREGRGELTVADRPSKLKRFFADIERPLSALTEQRCQQCYDALVDGTTRYGAPLAVATHRQLLRYARAFATWCVSTGRLRTNPLSAVRFVGKPRVGKEQLRFDEARRWLEEADRQATEDEAAVAAMAALVLGLRAGAILSRTVRDLDEGGAVLWLIRPGTPSTKRTPPLRGVPPILQHHLLRLADGKAPNQPLIPCPWKNGRGWIRAAVHRICAAAKVPKVTTHSFRGLHATILAEQGTAPHIVAAALGDTQAVAERHYIQPGTTEGAAQRRLLDRLSVNRSDFVSSGEISPAAPQISDGTTK